MTPKTTRILLVEDNPGDARLIREMLTGIRDRDLEIDWVTSLSQAVSSMAGGGIDLVILDLELPDSQGLDTFTRAYKHGPHLPFLVLTGHADENLGAAAVRRGAQDYLVKGEVTTGLFYRAIRYAIERKQAEQALQEGEEKYRLLVNQVPAVVFKERERFLADIFDSIQDGISILDTDFNILRVNRAMKLWFPHALPLAGKKCYAAYRQRSGPCEVCPSRETLETGKAVHAVMTKIGPDGEAAGWLEVYTFPMLEISSGKVKEIIQYIRDITKRKQAQEALQLSEEKYRLLVKQVPAVVFKGYEDWSVDFFDNKIEALTGYAKEEFDSRQRKWCELILPEDLEPAKGRFIKGIKTGGAYEREYRIWKKDGEIAWIQAMGQIFYDAEGKLDYISGVFFDITERVLAEQKLRESNERFATVFENAAIGIIVADAQGRIIAANPKFQEMLGYPARELLAKTFPEITHPEDLPKNLELFQEMMTGKRDGFLLEKRYLRKNGEYFWAQVNVSSIKETKEQLPYSIAVVRDITLRRQTQEKLEESARNLRYLAAQLLTAQERERQRISRDLHDDLGQSLVAFKLQLEAIEREEPANLTVLRQKLAIQIAFIDDIVNNVRRLCMDLRPTTLDALGLTVALKRLFKEVRALYGIKFSLHLEDVRDLLSLQAQIIIYRIFQESLTNIVKYAQATRIAVTIKREDSTVFFTVADNGKGFNLEQVRTRKDGKRGLGLVAMEERVRMLGGSLDMQSQKGVGTKISFKIPVS